LIDYINDLKKYKEVDLEKTPNPTLKKAREMQKEAQFLFDFVESENSSGFHAPQEAARLLGLSIDKSRQGQKLISELRKDEVVKK
jgi:nitrite reductase (cytochrome c-552)